MQERCARHVLSAYMETLLCLHLSTGLGKENLSLSSLSNKSSSLTLETNRQT